MTQAEVKEGEELAVPPLMSARRMVPEAVPSLAQSSMPEEPSLAVKTRLPPSATPFIGLLVEKALAPPPGAMSRTRVVPAVVPSVTQSSVPLVGSVAVKKTRSPTRTKLAGEELTLPIWMSRTRLTELLPVE